LIITDENTDRDQIERILGSLNDELPEDWVQHWDKNKHPKKDGDRRKGKIALNWLFESLWFVEDLRKEKLKKS
jgi:hypothetical protein